MAYVSFAGPPPALVFHMPATAAKAAQEVPTAALSALEWSVVALARQDSMASLRTPGRVAKAMAAIFGGSSENPIADPRLEALRRVSVHGWHRGFAIPESETRRFYDAGFSPDHLELVLTSISRARTSRGRRA